LRPEFWAIFTAVCWAVGSFLEKKGIQTGNLTPVMGTTIRTAVSLILLGFLSAPFWGELKSAGWKPVGLIAVGGGILAGGLGIVFLYTGLKTGHISTVMTIAFCLAPVFGVLIGFLLMGERLAAMQVVGIVLCITGAAMTVWFRPA
jgi:transporter family protein